MARYQVVLTRSAQRELADLPRPVWKRMVRAMRRLEEDPFRRRPGVDIKALTDRAGVYRLKVGGYRGVYEVEADEVVFTRFFHRSKGYRK